MEEYGTAEVVYLDLNSRNKLEKREKKEIAVMVCLIALLVALLFCKYFVFETVQVDGPSMRPTLETGDVLLINKYAEYDYGDIVVFKRGNKNIIKRVIGLPGDTVFTQNGEVYVKRVEGGVEKTYKIKEDYLGPGMKTYYGGGGDYFDNKREIDPCTVKEGELYVLGDNRQNSTDCRIYGAIKDSSVVGVVTNFSLKVKDSWLRFICYVI